MNISIEERIKALVLRSQQVDFVGAITNEQVIKAKELINSKGYSTTDFFVILSAINLLNAVIKQKEYKKVLSYIEIKGNVSRIFTYFSSLDNNKHNVDFYYNSTEKCAYFEIYGLQFSFHNINLNGTIKRFIDSDRNNVQPWKEIRLQKFAGEVFDIAIELKNYVS